MVILQRINNYFYSFASSSAKGMKIVAEALTFENPDPYAVPYINKFDRKKKVFRIGMLPTLIEYLKENGISYILNDYEFKIPNIKIDERLTGKYEHQKKAVEAFYKKRFGIISVPTRGGKTFIASEILRIFLMSDNGNFLFLVDNTTLFSQAINDIKVFFTPYGGIEIGEIKSGKIDLSQRICVGMIQTIQSTLSKRCNDKKKKSGLEKYLTDLKFLCVDEIHDNCSNAKLKIYKKAKKLEYLLCLSATPYRAGAFLQNLKLKEWSGDIIYNISEKELKNIGVLSEYKVVMLLVQHNAKFLNVDYASLLNAFIFDNDIRDNVLLSVVRLLENMKLKTLLLFQSIEHGKKFEKMSGITFISGETNNDKREEEKEKFLFGKGGFLSASNIFKKGVTLPSVEVLINVDGGLEDANSVQKKGRVLGATEEKNKSLIIDFFDFSKYFSSHSEARLNVYVEALGKDGVEILDVSITDWLEDLEKIITKWFEKDNDCLDLQ